MAIRVNLGAVLNAKNLKSKDLAEYIGITEANLSLLRQGKVKGIRFETLDAICRYLNCQPGDILAYDEDGNPLTTTFMDYLLPTAADVPTIEYGHVETMAPGPGGYKGVGEGGAIGAPPAVVNAVADALAPFGVEITRLPLTPAAIVSLLEAVGA